MIDQEYVDYRIAELPRAVDQGVAFLHERCPGWQALVTVEDLDPSPLDQLYYCYHAACVALDLSPGGATTMGFTYVTHDDTYEESQLIRQALIAEWASRLPPTSKCRYYARRVGPARWDIIDRSHSDGFARAVKTAVGREEASQTIFRLMTNHMAKSNG